LIFSRRIVMSRSSGPSLVWLRMVSVTLVSGAPVIFLTAWLIVIPRALLPLMRVMMSPALMPVL
jgi:hypothetical protein